MLSDLAWLPNPPSNFREERIKLKNMIASGEAGSACWSRLVGLAAYSLDESQLAHVAALSASLSDAPGVPVSQKLGIIGDGTLSLLGPAISASALRWGLRLEIVEGAYGMAVIDALNADSIIRRAEPDYVLVACDARVLGLDRLWPSPLDARDAVDQALAKIRAIVEGLRPSVGKAILVQTVVPPLNPMFGSFDLSVISSPFAQVAAFNAGLMEWASQAGVFLVDAARLAASVGLSRWEDPQQWHTSKLPFAFDMIPVYSDFLARTVGAIAGKSRKCLVLDLDNTLWGGVIGDDGVGGIVLGQGSAAGEAFLAIQQAALDLKKRGIVLAVCSKNEADAARMPFQKHSEMILREDDIAVFQANWTDKAANLKAIAEALNIGVDALVFLDDNPAERAQVRAELPMVAVPELPSSPALYPRMLLAAGYFDAITFGEDDRIRADAYQANVQRASLQAHTSDLSDYLQSLEMVATIQPFNDEGRARIAQLINKSNQFNLTTRRYTEQQVAAIELDPTKYHLQIHLADKFGNNGMISVVVADRAHGRWTIDTWLMSCRVLGRRVEEAVLANLVAAAKCEGAVEIIGRYIPTEKNRMVADHYRKLGFELIEETAGGESFWSLGVGDYVERDLPILIKNWELVDSN